MIEEPASHSYHNMPTQVWTASNRFGDNVRAVIGGQTFMDIEVEMTSGNTRITQLLRWSHARLLRYVLNQIAVKENWDKEDKKEEKS